MKNLNIPIECLIYHFEKMPKIEDITENEYSCVVNVRFDGICIDYQLIYKKHDDFANWILMEINKVPAEEELFSILKNDYERDCVNLALKILIDIMSYNKSDAIRFLYEKISKPTKPEIILKSCIETNILLTPTGTKKEWTNIQQLIDKMEKELK